MVYPNEHHFRGMTTTVAIGLPRGIRAAMVVAGTLRTLSHGI